MAHEASPAAATPFGLEFISTLGLSPPQAVALVAQLGSKMMGIAPLPIVGPLADQAAWKLSGNAALQGELKRALADHDVSLSLGEGFLIMPGQNIADAEGDIAMMAELGAERLNACALDPDRSRLLDEFGRFAEIAKAHGLPVTVEFIPGMAVDSLANAITFIRELGADNAGVLVDAMHLFASGGSAKELAEAPPGMVTYAQLCDARLPGAYDGYYEDARCNRPAPGSGILPLADFIAALPANCPIGLEVPMLARAEAGATLEALLGAALAASNALKTSRPETAA